MFCENCGAKVEDDSKFCMSCGAAINRDEPAQGNGNESVNSTTAQPFPADNTYLSSSPATVTQTQVFAPAPVGYPVYAAKPKKHFPLWALLTIIISAVVIIAVILFFVIASGASKPEKTVEKYFKAVTSGDYGTAYDTLNYSNSGLTTKDAYIAFMKQNEEAKTSAQKKATVTEFTITRAKTASDVLDEFVEDTDGKSTSSQSSDKSAGLSRYVVTYKLSNSNKTQNMTVWIKKGSSKQFLFFDNYKVDGSDGLVKDCTLTVPPSAKIKIDGIDMPETALVEDDTYEDSLYKRYKMPAVFSGSHKFEISAPYMDNISKTFALTNERNYSFTSFTFNTDTKNAISKISNELIPKLLEAAGDQQPFDEFSGYCSSNQDGSSSLKGYYNSVEEYFSSLNVSALKLNDIESSSYGNCSDDEGISFYDKYIIKYTLTVDGTDTDLTSSVNLIYIFENNEWKVKEAY